MLDPRRLLTFRAVARAGSFSRAAEALALSQPAVSQQVGALERELGTQLLVRGRGGTVPTEAGALLLEHADAVADGLAVADRQLGELAARGRHELRLGAFPSAIATLVPEAVATLRGARPNLEVAVGEGSHAELAALVRSGELHAGLCFQDLGLPRREPAGVRRTDIEEEPMVALLPAGHRLARRKRIALAELAEDRWTVPSADGIIVRACRAAGFEPRVAIYTRDPLAVRGIAAAGLAVSLTPLRLTRLGLTGIATPALVDPPLRVTYLLLPAVGAHPLAGALTEALREAAG
jgi:DNA-binding transcriptional LysR family regulator